MLFQLAANKVLDESVSRSPFLLEALKSGCSLLRRCDPDLAHDLGFHDDAFVYCNRRCNDQMISARQCKPTIVSGRLALENIQPPRKNGIQYADPLLDKLDTYKIRIE